MRVRQEGGGRVVWVAAVVLGAAGTAIAAAVLLHAWPWLPPGAQGDYDLRLFKLMLVLEGGGLAALGAFTLGRAAWLARVGTGRPLVAHAHAALAVLCLSHAAAFLFYFPPQQILSDEPIHSGEHLGHDYSVFAGERLLADGWRTWGYDPFVLCGSPTGLAFDPETRGETIFAHALSFLGRAYATKAYVLLVHGLLPLVLYAAARVAGVGRGAAVFGAWLGVLHWHWGRPFLGLLRWSGNHSFLFGCELAVLGVACAARVFDADHRRRLGAIVALGFVLAAVGWVQPAGWLLLAPALVALPVIGRGRLRRRDRAALLLAVAAAAAVQMPWAAPAARAGSLFGGVEIGLRLARATDAVALFLHPSSGPALGILACGVAGLASLRRSRAAATGVIATTALAWIAAAAFGPALGPLARIECARALVPVVLLLALPAGVVLARSVEGRGLVPAALRVPLLVVATTLPPFAGLLDARFYYVHRLDATLDRRVPELMATLDGAAAESGRVLFESTANAATPLADGIALEALVPLYTRRELVGPAAPGAAFDRPELAFAGGALGGRALATWTPEAFAAFLSRYDIATLVAWSPGAKAFLGGQAPLVVPLATAHGFDLFSCRAPSGRVARGSARVRADYDRIELTEVRGDEIVLRMCWMPGLVALPATAVGPVVGSGELAGFLHLQPAGRERFVLRAGGHDAQPRGAASPRR